MRRLKALLALLCIAVCVSAQVPQKIAYQAVLRNGEGSVIANEDVVVRIGLLQGSANGSVVYSEQHEVTTSAQGIISLAIGDGTPDSDEFQFWNIPWNSEIFIKIEIKRDGSSDFVAMQPNKVLSVPYSFRAKDVLYADTAQFANSASSARSVQGAVTLQPNKSHRVDSPIFVVRNSAGEVVFSVYDEGLRAYVGNSAETGGFVVKGQDADNSGYLVVSPDSTRVYANNSTRGPRSGFAVGGRAGQKTGNQTYFAVSPYLTEVYFDTTMAKGPRSGFAVGGRAGQKGESNSYLTVTPAITEVSFDGDAAKGSRSGFAVGGRAGQKDEAVDYLSVTSSATNVYVDQAAKGARSGFAVGGRAGQKGEDNSYLFVNPDSTRVYFEDVSKGPRSGFAVGGRAGQKGSNGDILLVSPQGTNVITSMDENSTDNGLMGGFDVGGVTSTTPTYTSYFSVTPTVITITPTIVSSGTVEITGDVVENYDPTDVQDGAGNWYKTIQIGNNRWLKSNLRTTKYSDGTDIEPSAYMTIDSSNNNVLGLYYQHYLIQDYMSNICPIDWHVATMDDWNNAHEYLLSQGVPEDDMLNNVALAGYWENSPNVVPVDTFGLSIPAAGYFSYATGITDLGKSAIYWMGGFNEMENTMIFNDSLIGMGSSYQDLNSVRCVQGAYPLTVRTEYYDSVLTNSAIFYGMILIEGGSEIVERGFCYGTSVDPTFADSRIVSTDTIEYFSAKATDLQDATSYFYRAYAFDATDTVFGESMQIRTASYVTEVYLDSVSDVTINSATVFSRIYGLDVLSSGLCCSTSDVIALDSEETITVYNQYVVTGELETKLYDLQPTTLYNVCAFAITESDTIFSEMLQFETLYQAPTATISTVTFPAQGTALVSLYLEGDFTGYSAVGVCYGTSEFPTVSDSIAMAPSLNAGSAEIILDNLSTLTTYYARLFFASEVDVTYGEQLQFITPAAITSIVLNPVDEVTSNSAVLSGVLNGEIDYNLSIGICYAPMVSKELAADTLFMDAHFVGDFRTVLEGLSPETEYMASAFVITSIDGVIDTTLGNSVIFTTLADTTIYKGDVILHSQEEIDQFVAQGYTKIDGNLMVGNISSVDSLNENIGEALGYYCMGITPIDNIDTLNITSVTGFVMLMGVETGTSPIFLANIENLDTLAVVSCSIGETFDVYKYSQLRYLSCYSSNITNLELTENSALEYLNCSSNMLESLDVSNCPNLTELLCSGCEMISELNLSGNAALRVIDCSRNQITNLDFSANTNLTSVICSENQLTTLDLSQCSQLMYLDCSMSQLSSLKLGTCNTLETLMCQGNQLTRLNIRNAHKITELMCGNQQADSDLLLFTNEVGLIAFENNSQMNVGVIPCINPVYFYQMGFTVEPEVVNLFGNMAVSDTTLVSEMGVCYSSTTGSPTIDSCEVLTVPSEGDFLVSLNNFTPATSYTVREFATFDGITYYGDSTVFTTLNVAPTVKTLDVENTTGEYAVLHGEAEGNNISQYGFCYSPYDSTLTLNTTDLVIDHTNLGQIQLSFSDTLLLGYPMYYVRAYAVNEIDTAYGQVVNFIPVMLPELDSVMVDSVTANRAFFSAKIISDGGLEITERGFNIVNNNAQVNIGGDTLKLPSTDTSNVFTASYSEFEPGSFYIVSAYAKNSIGEVTSEEVEFSTLSYPSTYVYAVDTLTGVTDTSIALKGYSTYGYNLDTIITQWGFCYGTEPNPTIDGLYTVSTDSCSSFSETLTGLQSNTNYYIRAYSISAAGTVYSDNLEVRTHGVPSIVMSSIVKQNFEVIADYSIVHAGGATIDSCGVLIGESVVIIGEIIDESMSMFNIYFSYLSPVGAPMDTTFNIKPFAANKYGIGYGEVNTVVISTDTSITTLGASDIAYTSAVINLEITADFAENMGVGACVWPVENAIDTLYFEGDAVNGSSSIPVFGLTLNTRYYAKSYIIFGEDTLFSNTIEFQTLDYGSATDIDGNTYKTIIFGDNEWFAENLKTTNYNDGTPIPYVDSGWENLSSGAYCYSDNDSSAISIDSLGLLYNWYAVDTWELCPEGWVVATEEQWYTWQTIAMDNPAVLKEPGTWPVGFDDGTNDYLFSARQVTIRQNDGAYSATNTPQSSDWWSSTLLWNIYPYHFLLGSDISLDYTTDMRFGMSVRCARPLKTPVARIDTVFDITKTTATISGRIVFGGQISRKGVLILQLEDNQSFGPTMEEYTYLYEIDPNLLTFDVEIASLKEATKYSVVIFTEVNGTISYSDFVEFTTEYPPTDVKLVSIFDVNTVRANVNWTVFSYQEEIIRLGICYGTDSVISIENSNFQELTDTYATRSLNSYNQTLVDLRPNQKYYVKAILEDNDNVYYSNLMEFTTDSIKYGSPITDSDNNEYQTIIIGEQEWMASNLRTTKLFDGTPITNITDQSWSTFQSAAYCWYNNEEVNAEPYGALYNNIAAINDSICPMFWHVATQTDYRALVSVLADNGYGFNGNNDWLTKALASNTLWDTSSTAGTAGYYKYLNNTTGLSIFPAGNREDNDNFVDLGTKATLWAVDSILYTLSFGNNTEIISFDTTSYQKGYSVRCIRTNVPTVDIDSVVNKSGNSFTAYGHLLDHGTASIEEFGFIDDEETLYNAVSIDEQGYFMVEGISVELNVSINLKAFARNKFGMGKSKRSLKCEISV